MSDDILKEVIEYNRKNLDILIAHGELLGLEIQEDLKKFKFYGESVNNPMDFLFRNLIMLANGDVKKASKVMQDILTPEDYDE